MSMTVAGARFLTFGDFSASGSWDGCYSNIIFLKIKLFFYNCMICEKRRLKSLCYPAQPLACQRGVTDPIPRTQKLKRERTLVRIAFG